MLDSDKNFEILNNKNILDKKLCEEKLSLILLWQCMDIDLMWEEFKKEIKYESRFFPKARLLEKISNYSSNATTILKKGTKLYRARKYDSEDQICQAEVEDLYKKIRYLNSDANLKINDLYSGTKWDFINLYMLRNDKFSEEYVREVEKIIGKNKKFWGFNSKDSDAPPKEFLTEGRANASHIRYLYTAENLETAITEVQPKINQGVSVAEVVLINDIKLFDFCKKSEMDSLDFNVTGLHYLSQKFSEPNYGSTEDYYPTQYICEYIKEMGFDGIRFYSSLKKEGINIVLFDTNMQTKSYKISKSKVYKVDYVDIKFSQMFPVSIDKKI